jgi:hypothetical protein
VKRLKVRVDSGSLVYVDRNAYSVNSRLIGEQVEARLSTDTVEIWYANRKVEQLPRLRGRGKHRIDYRPMDSSKSAALTPPLMRRVRGARSSMASITTALSKGRFTASPE